MPLDVLSRYIGMFGSLHRYRNEAPHKPILLPAVLNEIERGNIRDNLIVLTPELAAAFSEYWRILVPEGNGLTASQIPSGF